ncbi:MAG: CHAD domain-containing protein [Steroidobacteraceae bacterium]|nr:CHAD domain-containing protein [Deltaproteobacteria bacterium]
MPSKPVRLPPDTATILERSRGILFAQWEELLRLRRAVLKSFDTDDIHDLRVASRRIRAVLELYYPLVPKGSKAELRESVRKLTRMLGGLRNIDEAQIFFRSRANSDASGDSRLCRTLSKLRSRELRRIGKALKNFDHRNLDRTVRQIVAGLNEDCLAERNRFSLLACFSEVSIRLYLPIHQLLAVSTAPGQRASRHALRIAIKKWRYFFEIIAQVLGSDYTHILELLKEYQSLLGRMNDIAEFGELLARLELPRHEREQAEELLLAEDALLLESFTELIGRKPLAYTFLI